MVNAIFARGRNGEFALADGSLPWSRLPEGRADMARFKKITSGGILVMGRNTFATLKHPLPARLNLVADRNCREIPGLEFQDERFVFFPNVESAARAARERFPKREIFIIGGAKIFSECFKKQLIDGLVHETVFRSDFPGAEIFIPPMDENSWREISSEEIPGATFKTWSPRARSVFPEAFP